MHQTQHQQPYTPTKVTGSCFRCKKPGHWANNCPENPNNRSPISPSAAPTTTDPDFPSIHCQCGAGLCQIRVSGSQANPNRKYYRCPGKFDKYCGYFKWCDQLRREEVRQVQPESFPICGCGAGICSVKVEEYGVNAGRSYFACPIKKGDGACNFRQWVDYSPESTSVASEDALQQSLSDEFDLCDEAEMQIDAMEMRYCDKPLIEVQVLMENEETPDGDGGGPAESPEVLHLDMNNVSYNIDSDMTLQNNGILINRMGDCKMESAQASITTVVANLNNPVSQGPFPNANPVAQPKGHVSVSSGSLANSSPHLEAQPWSRLLLDKSSFLKDGLSEGSIMAGTILQAFEQLAASLQNNLITLLESMGPQNHVNMRKEADCTFAALDHLHVDRALFKLRINEFIEQAALLALFEKTINEDSSSQEVLGRYNKEQSRFKEIFHDYCQAKEAFIASNKQLILLSEKAASLNDSSVETKVELSCCEAENAAYRDRLLQITKTMTDCKENLQVASREASDALKQSEEREIERSAKMAAFEKAKAQLRS